jgi:hypothetical protein
VPLYVLTLCFTCVFRFSQFDRDASLGLSREEFTAYSSVYGGSLSFDIIDTDRDRILSEREITELMVGDYGIPNDAWLFSRYDIDLNQKWSSGEYAAYAKAFGPLENKNATGRSQSPSITNLTEFDFIDVSGDGFISSWEFSAFLSPLPSDYSQTAANEYSDMCSVYVSLVYNQTHHSIRNISLWGRRRAEVANGIATFTDLSLTQASYTRDQQYSLRFSFQSPGNLIAVDSPPFSVMPASPYRMILIQPPSGARPGSILEKQPVVDVIDVYDNVVRGNVGYLAASLESGSGRAGVPLYGNRNMTLEEGRAIFTDLKCKVNGVFTMRFMFFDPSVAPLYAQLSVSLGNPHHLALLRQPTGMVAGQAAHQQPMVALQDASDNLVPVSTMITVSVLRLHTFNSSFPKPQVALFREDGTIVDTNILHTQRLMSDGGLARFTNLGVAGATTELNLVLYFGVESLPSQYVNVSVLPVKSQPFNLSDPRGVQTLVLMQAPAIDWAAFGGELMTAQPVIWCGDINGSLVETDNTTFVDVSIVRSQPCCGLIGGQFETPTLGGRTSMAATGGKVLFSDLRIDKIGKHLIRFRATSGARASVHLDVASAFGGVGKSWPYSQSEIETSTWVVVRPGRAFRLQVVQEALTGMNSGGTSTGLTNEPFARQPAIVLWDRGGNRISDEAAWSASASITATLVQNACAPLPECCGGEVQICLQRFGTNGLKGTFELALKKGGILYSDLSISRLGSYSLLFYATSLQPAISSTVLQIIAGTASQILVETQPKEEVNLTSSAMHGASVSDSFVKLCGALNCAFHFIPRCSSAESRERTDGYDCHCSRSWAEHHCNVCCFRTNACTSPASRRVY